jgi:uncharacterized caspase-like protein
MRGIRHAAESVALLLIPCVLVALTVSIAEAKRVALVVGNGAYANAPALPNPANDAKAIAAELETLGFEVHLALDVTQQAGLDALDGFAEALPGAEAAVFFYSGHGMQIDGANFLLPVDVEATSERAVRYGSIDIAEIVREMETNAEVALVVLDACRDNPFAAQIAPRSRSTAPSRGLAVIKPSGNGTIIAYAAAAGATASDGEGEHSPYTAALLKHVGAANVELGLMFRRVAGDVVAATNNEQQPEVLIRLTREFYMKTEAVEAAPAVVAAPATPEITVAEAPPAPTAGGDVARTPAAPSYQATPESAPPRVWSRKGPYADLLARLDLDPPLYPAAVAWTAPPKRAFSEIEPNNSFGSASPIEANATVDLSIEATGDADYLYFRAGSAGVLSFYGGAPPEIDLVMRMLNADGADMTGWVSAPRPGGVLEGWFDIPSPGAYWLEVRDGYNDSGSPARIALDLSFAPQEDGYEPNNTPSTARVLPLEGSHRLNILPLGDADYFVLPVKSPGELSVRATGVPEELDIALQLLDYDLNVVQGWVVAPRPGGDTDALIRVGAPGLYLLEVRDSYNDKRSGKAF